jgi:hypothetical protein
MFNHDASNGMGKGRLKAASDQGTRPQSGPMLAHCEKRPLSGARWHFRIAIGPDPLQVTRSSMAEKPEERSLDRRNTFTPCRNRTFDALLHWQGPTPFEEQSKHDFGSPA